VIIRILSTGDGRIASTPQKAPQTEDLIVGAPPTRAAKITLQCQTDGMNKNAILYLIAQILGLPD
jgi:hypothetical protein